MHKHSHKHLNHLNEFKNISENIIICNNCNHQISKLNTYILCPKCNFKYCNIPSCSFKCINCNLFYCSNCIKNNFLCQKCKIIVEESFEEEDILPDEIMEEELSDYCND